MEIVTKSEIAIVKDMMSKYGLTPKDLFSFCICAVNFLEYYEEESMYDMMWSCPERYESADSNNTKACAGALKGEQKSEGWTEVEQFTHYMESIQDVIAAELSGDYEDEMEHFLEEYQRFAKVYKRNILVPIMLGCPVEDYDDSKFDDPEYIKSIANVDGLVLYKKHEEERDAWSKKCDEERAAKLAKEVESKKDDKDFSVLLASCTNIANTAESFEEYNKTYYPERDYKVLPLKNPQLMIIQTGGQTIEEVKDRILKTVEWRIMIVGHELRKDLIPIEKVFKTVPQVMVDNKVTHVVTYI